MIHIGLVIVENRLLRKEILTNPIEKQPVSARQCFAHRFWDRYNSSCKVGCLRLLLPDATKYIFHLIFLILNHNRESCILFIIKIHLFRNATKKECSDHTNMGIWVLFQMQRYFTLQMNPFSIPLNASFPYEIWWGCYPDPKRPLVVLTSWYYCPCIAPLTLTQSWTEWQTEHSANDSIWLPMLGHRRHFSFYLSLLDPSLWVKSASMLCGHSSSTKETHMEENRPLPNSQHQPPRHMYASHWKWVVPLHASLQIIVAAVYIGLWSLKCLQARLSQLSHLNFHRNHEN